MGKVKSDRPLLKFGLYDGMRFERYQEAAIAAGKDPEEAALVAEDCMYEWVRRQTEAELKDKWMDLNRDWLAWKGHKKGTRRAKKS